jgi:phosphate transport system substrate-binding protein
MRRETARARHARPGRRGRRRTRCRTWIGLAAPAVALAAAGPAAFGQTLHIEGSETLRPMVRDLSEAFRERHAAVAFEVGGRGSSTGPPALLAGRAQIAAMSRPLNPAERRAFERRFGMEPRVVTLALDALVFFVNEENPVERVTLAQLDAVFSKSLRCGGEGLPVRHWGDLGATGEWADRRIQVFGRGVRSGTRAFMREGVLCGGLFRDDLRERPGPESLVLSVAESRFGLGYGSLAQLRSPGVKPLALAERDGGPGVAPTPGSVESGTYPLTRRLELVTLAMPDRAQAEPIEAFLGFALSEKGRSVVAAHGYVPPAAPPAPRGNAPRAEGAAAARGY